MTVERLRAILTTSVSCGCIVAVLVAVAAAFMGGYPNWQFLYANSDLLYLPVLFEDLFHYGGHIGDWYFPPAPYVFPDWAIFGLAFSIGRNAMQQAMLFALVQIVLFAAVLFRLYRVSAIHVAAPLTAAVVGLVAFLALRDLAPFQHLVMSGYHFGGFLVMLACLPPLLTAVDAGRSGLLRSVMPIAALVCIATGSDGLVLFQLVVPLVATLAFVSLVGTVPRRRALAAAVTVAAGGALGLLAQPLLIAHRGTYPAAIDVSGLGGKLASLAGLLALTPAISTFACGFTLFCLGRGLFLACARRGRTVGPLDVLLVFAIVSALSSPLVPLLFDSVSVVARYFIGFYLLPVVLIPIALCRFGGRPALWLVPIAAMMSGVAVAWLGAALVQGRALHLSFYPDDVACIDRTLAEHGYRYGIAGYWDAKYIEGLSRTQLRPAQYGPGLEPYPWITTSAYLRPDYDYAIVSDRDAPSLRLPRDAIDALNGPADSVVRCGAFEVLGYADRRMRVQ